MGPAGPADLSADRRALVSVSEALDLESIAIAEGLTVNDAFDRYWWQTQFADAAYQVSLDHPDTFVRSEMHPDASTSAAVYFSGSVPSGVAAKFASLPVTVQLVGNAGPPESAWTEQVNTVHYGVNDSFAGDDNIDVSTAYDWDEREIVVTVGVSGNDAFDNQPYPTPDPSVQAVEEAAAESVEQSSEEIAAEADAGAGVTYDPIPVRVEVLESAAPLAGDDVVRGGAFLGGSSSSSFRCTSGWSVYKKNAPRERGIVTADHCNNSLSYSGRGVLTYINSMPKSKGDVQYMRSSEAVTNEFYYRTGKYRRVTRQGPVTVGQQLCKFGRKTGETCDPVHDKGSCRGDYCGLVMMSNRKADGGDSGGPWYYSNTAYGVHSGYTTHTAKRRDQFTPLNGPGFAEMTVGLLTSP